MKRDLELVRSLMLFIESNEVATFWGLPEECAKHFPDVPQMKLVHHIQLLRDAGFIMSYGKMEAEALYNVELSWEGHEFLAVLKDDTYWTKLKSTVAASGSWTVKSIVQGGIAFGVKAILGG